MNRRAALAAFVAASAVLPGTARGQAGQEPTGGDQPALSFRIGAGYRPDLSRRARRRLTATVLEFLEAFHPPGMSMAFWERNPADIAGLEEHLDRVVRAVMKGVEAQLDVQPVEPLLVLAVLYNESRFLPTALSPFGALGVAQFMPSTAVEYGLAPGAHFALWERYRALRVEERRERARRIQEWRDTFGVARFSVDAAIGAALARGDLAVLEAFEAIRQEPSAADAARSEYVATVRASLAEYDFLAGDLRRLEAVDARTGYEAVTAAVDYLARRLRENGGMVTSAIAAYNAGPSAVRVSNTSSILHRYGAVPAYDETVLFVQRVLAAYIELQGRKEV